MDRDKIGIPVGFWIVWVVAALAGVGLTGAIVWGIVKLVQHFAG